MVAGAENGREMVCFGQRGYSSDQAAVTNALEDVVREIKHKIETAKEPDGWRAKRDTNKKRKDETWQTHSGLALQQHSPALLAYDWQECMSEI